MEADELSRTSSKAAKATADAATPEVLEFETQNLSAQQPKEQPGEAVAKRKRNGEPPELPSKKPREEEPKHGDEPAGAADNRLSPLKDDSGEYHEVEGDSDTDPVPPVTSISRASAESDEPMPRDHQSQDMSLGDDAVMANSPFDKPENDLRMFNPTFDSIDMDFERDREASKDDGRPSGVLEIFESKEHDMLSAVMSLTLANRGLADELDNVEHYKGGRAWYVERIQDIEYGEHDTFESELPVLKSKLEAWDNDLDYYHFSRSGSWSCCWFQANKGEQFIAAIVGMVRA